MSSPQIILPHSPMEQKHASDTSSDIDEKLSAHDDLEGKKEVGLAAPRKDGAEASISYNEDGDLVGFEEGVGAVGLSWYKKGPALLFILLFVLGSNFAGSALGPLKSTIKSEMKMNNARYGTLATADSLINTILPVFTGLAIDYYGPTSGAIVASTFILIGQMLSSVGATVKSYPLLLVGQIILGFGSTAVETAQSKLYTHWFKGNSQGGIGILGFVYGLDVGVGRVYNLAGKLSAVPVVEASGNWTWGFWLPTIMCGLSFAITIGYAFFEKSIPKANRVLTGQRMAAIAVERGAIETRTTFAARWQFVVLSIFAIPAAFWLITISQLLQAGAVLTYTSNLADMIAVTRGSNRDVAGYTSAIGQIMPIVLTPVLGYGFDRFGRRMHLVTFTAALWVLVFALLGFTSVHAMVPTILGSLALSTNTLPFIASIPLLVPSQANIGTAFGLWKAFNSSGTTILTVAAGAIQDITPTGSRQYNNVFYLLIALKSIDVFYGLGYHWFDIKYLKGILRASEKQRVHFERTESDEQHKLGLRGAIKKFTWAGIAVGVALITTAYVVYCVYAIGT